MMSFIENKQLIEDVYAYDVILVGTHINNSLGNGFQYQMRINFPEVENANNETNYGDKRKLGTVKVVKTKPTVCLLYITTGNYRPDLHPDNLDYDSLESCMKLINENFPNKNIATTLIGGSTYDGNGDNDKIIEILKNNSSNFDLFIYNAKQINVQEDRNLRWKNIISQIGNISREEYEKLKKEYYWQNAFGIYKPVPYELNVYELKKYIKEHKKRW